MCFFTRDRRVRNWTHELIKWSDDTLLSLDFLLIKLISCNVFGDNSRMRDDQTYPYPNRDVMFIFLIISYNAKDKFLTDKPNALRRPDTRAPQNDLCHYTEATNQKVCNQYTRFNTWTKKSTTMDTISVKKCYIPILPVKRENAGKVPISPKRLRMELSLPLWGATCSFAHTAILHCPWSRSFGPPNA